MGPGREDAEVWRHVRLARPQRIYTVDSSRNAQFQSHIGRVPRQQSRDITGTEVAKSQRWDTSIFGSLGQGEAFWRNLKSSQQGLGKGTGRGGYEPSERMGSGAGGGHERGPVNTKFSFIRIQEFSES